ncbi:MAG: hypothetical protein J3R72DRAFT_497483 [Linnemannia gamsii]|nr:MAG: hypothetical protein J3R72DRAFT_497483 [Linnemannia gamsii]
MYVWSFGVVLAHVALPSNIEYSPGTGYKNHRSHVKTSYSINHNTNAYGSLSNALAAGGIFPAIMINKDRKWTLFAQ